MKGFKTIFLDDFFNFITCFHFADCVDLTRPTVTNTKLNQSHIVLQCNASGYPIPSFTWKHPLYSPEDDIGNVSHTSTLVLPIDAPVAQYSCEVKNDVGELATSSTASHSCMCFFF